MLAAHVTGPVETAFPDGPPKYIRASLYRYHLARYGEKGWWNREYVDEWLPPLNTEDPRLLEWMRTFGWSTE